MDGPVNLAQAKPDVEDDTSKEQIEKTYVLQWRRVLGTISRGLTQFIIQIFVLSTFYYTAKTGINSGIIASVFSTNLIFVTLYFYCFKGQRLTCNDTIGSLLIITCLVMIGIGGAGSGGSRKLTEQE